MMMRTFFSCSLMLSLAGCDSCSKPLVYGSDAAPAPTIIFDAEPPLNVTPVPTASVAAMLNPDHLPAYAGPTGSLEGTISVKGPRAEVTKGDWASCDATGLYGHSFREGEPAAPPEGPRWIADAVIVVIGYSNFYVREKDEAEELTIDSCAFTKRTVTLTYGQRLEVKNLTKEFWTPVLEQPSGVSHVTMMAAPKGDPVKLYPKVPGHYHLVDHDRKWALVDVYAFLHPLHASSGINGTYRIDGIPVGKVTVNTTHPALKDSAASQDVDIKQGQVAHVDLVIENKPQPDAGADKTDAGKPFYPRLH